MRLKTSEQIYHQIRWDPGIPEERVVIVYEDRQVGLRGIAFPQFTPGGRIPWSRLWRYELDGRVIWDRAKRIDRVSDVRQHSRARRPDARLTALPLWRFDAGRGEWLPWKQGGAALPEQCSVLTLNILFDDYKPERIDTPRRTAALLALLAEEQPTLIALQEVKKPVLRAILEDDRVRQGYFVSEGPAGDTVLPYGQVLLSRVPPDRLQQIRFNQSKRAIVASFGPLSVAVVHLTSDRGRNSRERRADQLGRLLEHLTGDLLIVGDLNFGDEHTEPLLADFDDLWPQLRPDEPGFTYAPTENDLAGEMSQSQKSRRLDRLLLRADASRVVATGIDLVGTEPLPQTDPPLFLSDHYGLQATLHLGAAEAALATSPTTHRTAAVVCPPRALWGPIQAIRRLHDRSFERWMPHINLLYGFLPEPLFDAAAERLARALADLPPAEITLDRIGRFDHASSVTLYLAPDPPSARRLAALQAAMQAALPQCTEQNRGGTFTPHLTLARCKPGQAQALQAQLDAEAWSVRFVVRGIDLISRRQDAPFAPRRTVALQTGRVTVSPPAHSDLRQTLTERGRIMTSGQRRRREAVVAQLSEVIGGPVFPMGSARLSVDGPGSDLDLLGVSRSALPKVRARVLEALGGRAVDAVVPVIKLTVAGVAVDLLLARYPAALPLVDPNALTEAQRGKLSSADARAALGCLEAEAIRSAVGEREADYRLALRMVRAWAAARQIDAHALGYPGGISWAILLAATPPQPDAARWVEAMLSGLLEWDGAAPLGIDPPHTLSSQQVACILTSVEPRVNSVRNMIPTTLTVLREEVALGLERVWEIREGRRPWSALLEPARPAADPARIRLSVVGVGGAARVRCQGWVAGHILGLLIDLERRPGLPMRPYPAGSGFEVCIGLLRAPEGEERVKIAESVEGFVARFSSWSGCPRGAGLVWQMEG